MFKFITDQKIGFKMLGSFVLILTLMLVVSIVALARLSRINDTVTLMATHLSAEQKDASALVGYVEDMRFHAVRYIAGGDEEDFHQHQINYTDLQNLVTEMAAEDVDQSTDMTTLEQLLSLSDTYAGNMERVNIILTSQQADITAQMDQQAVTVNKIFSHLRDNFVGLNDAGMLDTVGSLMLNWDNIQQAAAELPRASTTDFEAIQPLVQQTVDGLDTLSRNQLSEDDKTQVSQLRAGVNAYYLLIKDLKDAISERQNLLTDQNSIGEQMLTIAKSIADDKEAAFLTAQGETQQLVTQTRNILIPLIAITVILGILIGWIMTRIITSSLGYLVKAAKAMKLGDTSASVEKLTYRGDEIGEFAHAFEAVIQSQKELAGVATSISQGDLTVECEPRSEKDTMGIALKNMLGSFREQTSELMNGVAVLSSASSQFISTAAKLAASATETASAISETTATIAEVRQTAEVATEKSQVVAEMVQENAEYSRDGLVSVEEAVGEMERIDGHISSIAESIIHLSEQGQTIGGIITAVDDLAEQSNLLAVNAAIEAAKAGEHGKGFAVVAQEIKNLAEQSKQFTVQVQTILNDIQKATAKAVMTTEKGSKSVAKGKKLSHDAGESIRGLTEHVTEAAQASMHISASSKEQLIGVEQVAIAMENIKQASSQNVEGARQLESASLNLEQLATQIQQLFTKFQL